MADLTKAIEIYDSNSVTHENLPSLQQFNPILDNITKRIPHFEESFNRKEFEDTVKRIQGSDGSDDSPTVEGRFGGLVDSPDLIRERRRAECRREETDALGQSRRGEARVTIQEPLNDVRDGARAGDGLSWDHGDGSRVETVPTLHVHATGASGSGDGSRRGGDGGSPATSNLRNNHVMVGGIQVPMHAGFLNPFQSSSRIVYKYTAPEVMDGSVIIRPSWDMAEKGKKMWSHMVVGYFIGKSPAFTSVRNYVLSVWKGVKDVKANSNGFFFFQFESKESMLEVIEGGPWMFAGQPLFLETWTEGMSLEKRQHKEVPVWIKLRNIPLEYWSDEGLSLVASGVGRPLYPDAFTAKRSHLDYARICVMVDINNKFRDHLLILLPVMGGGFNGSCRVEVEYEWKPKLCGKCKSFGHGTGECRSNVGQVRPPVRVYASKPRDEEQWETVRNRKGKAKVSESEKEGANASPTIRNAFQALEGMTEVEGEETLPPQSDGVNHEIDQIDDDGGTGGRQELRESDRLAADELLRALNVGIDTMRGPIAAPHTGRP